MRLFLSGFLFLSFFFTTATQTVDQKKVVQTIETIFNKADHTELGKMLTSTVTLELLQNSGQWNASQAMYIVRDFFSAYPVKSFTTTDFGINPYNRLFLAGLYETGDAIYDVYIVFKEENKETRISILKIKEQ